MNRLLTSEEGLDAADLRRVTSVRGATSAGECCDRQRVTVHGVVRSVVVRPLDGAPTLEVEVFDGTGNVVLVFLGRRRIPAMECGRTITAHGLVLRKDEQPKIYNPAYELDPLPA